MNILSTMISMVETLALAALILSQARLRTRLKHLNAGDGATVAQMRELVQEAQVLSTALTAQLAEQVRLVEAHRSGTDRVQSNDTVVLGAQSVTAAARAAYGARAGGPADPMAADNTLARRRSMDPLGVAIQRNLQSRRAMPA